jgi:hypothetical protein
MSSALDDWEFAVCVPDKKNGRELANEVAQTLEKAKELAKPLRDPALERKIGEAVEHVKTKIDPRTG